MHKPMIRSISGTSGGRLPDSDSANHIVFPVCNAIRSPQRPCKTILGVTLQLCASVLIFSVVSFDTSVCQHFRPNGWHFDIRRMSQ